LLAEGIIVVVLWVLPRYRGKRFLERLGVPELQAKMLEALKTLERAPNLERQGGQPLHTLPWYLLLGASQSGTTTLLHAVSEFLVPFARPSPVASVPTQNCDWWLFHPGIILDTAGRYAFPPQGDHGRNEWHCFLELLRHYRERQPLNGVIITVAMDTLVTKTPEALRREAAELRQRIDEATRVLGILCPVYLLVTRCDLLEGFTEFFSALPERTLQQAFG